jgi:hypothetical protein
MFNETQTQNRESWMFNLGVQCASNDYRKEYATMRAAILDALWTVDVRTRKNVLAALNEFQPRSDWNFDLD